MTVTILINFVAKTKEIIDEMPIKSTKSITFSYFGRFYGFVDLFEAAEELTVL